MASFWWFLLSTFTAAIAVGLATLSVPWGSATFIVLLALRNVVMAGYVEGRRRFEQEQQEARARTHA